jgi:hypothetical protein
MPSLHMATALLLVFFSNRNRCLLGISCAFLAGTVCATLALEHYVVDLIVAVPFTCVAFELAHGRVIRAIKYLGVVLGWLLLIRFAWPALLQHAWTLRFMAMSSVAVGVHAIVLSWRKCDQQGVLASATKVAAVGAQP